ncbi:MAG TPA: hypothetical protein VJ742_07155 [Nitrososphaera sp.]|jgi:hypothetical protein|nr:hypothetical protein [Nitrososphaera sp.]
MNPTEYCAACNEGIQWKCSVCEKENDKSVHTYHPGTEELSTTVHSSIVGTLAFLATGLIFAETILIFSLA